MEEPSTKKRNGKKHHRKAESENGNWIIHNEKAPIDPVPNKLKDNNNYKTTF